MPRTEKTITRSTAIRTDDIECLRYTPGSGYISPRGEHIPSRTNKSPLARRCALACAHPCRHRMCNPDAARGRRFQRRTVNDHLADTSTITDIHDRGSLGHHFGSAGLSNSVHHVNGPTAPCHHRSAAPCRLGVCRARWLTGRTHRQPGIVGARRTSDRRLRRCRQCRAGTGLRSGARRARKRWRRRGDRRHH